MSVKPAIVAVVPAAERIARTRLFDAFEQAYPVRFEGRDSNALAGADGALYFPGADSGGITSATLPTVRFGREESPQSARRVVALTSHPLLARPLWGAHLTETCIGDVDDVTNQGEILATVAGRAAWHITMVRGVAQHDVCVAPAELGVRDALRSRLAPGRNLAVLALAQFIRSLLGDSLWETPGIRAAFLIDDPNLRRPTYGHINYAEMAASAAASDYHVSIAMVPLDGRSFHQTPIQLFRNSRHLSLCIHGNDHVRQELWRPRSLAEGRVPAAQAIRRSLNFERRTGLTIDRIMVAPHEALGEASAQGLLACGFEAFSGTRPYPWLEYGHDLPWLSRPADAGPLVGWGSAEIVGRGLPALLRLDFRHSREELVIRAFLGQPLIMYGHDDLLRGGPGELEAAAAEIGRLGDVTWQSLSGIARGSIEHRRNGSVLEVRVLGRHVAFDVPDGVAEVRVDSARVRSSAAKHLSVTGPVRYQRGLDDDGTNARMGVERPGKVEIVLDHELDPRTVPAPPPSLRASARRIAAETRDRTRPKLSWALR